MKMILNTTYFNDKLRLPFIVILFFLTVLNGRNLSAQSNAQTYSTTGSFYALSVADVDASTKWYQDNLDLKVTMHAPKNEKFGLSVLEGHGMIVELVQNMEAVPLSKAAPSISQTHLVHGIYKVGIVVDDFDKMLAHFRNKGIPIVMGPFPPRTNQRANFAIKDNSGNVIMFFGKQL